MNFITAVFVSLAIVRAGFYLYETKKTNGKMTFKNFFRATYTEEDFEELKQDIAKEMKIKEVAKETASRC